MTEPLYKFRDNPHAPVIFIHHLHDVHVINGIVRFVPVNFLTEGGEVFGEPPVLIEMRPESVPPAITLTVQRTATGLLVPVVNKVREALWLN